MQADQVVGLAAFGQLQHVAYLFVGEIEQGTRLFADLGHDHVAEQRQQITRHVRGVVALIRELGDDVQSAASVTAHERSGDVVKHFAAGHAEHTSDSFPRQRVSAPSDHLVE